MSEEINEVWAAIQEHRRCSDKETEFLMRHYEGRHGNVRGFFRRWLETRLGEQAEWMLNYIKVELIADVAVEMGRVVTVPAKPSADCLRSVYVFLVRPRS